ncbi:MAG: BTAD domain-containing putative transcriptional regulator [Chloroflexota bacterium]
MNTLSIDLLGPLSVTLNNQPIDTFSTTKVRGLLAYLAVEGLRPLDRSHLAGLLWPDIAEESARGNLRHGLANLRKAIGDRNADPSYLLVNRRTIQLNSAALDVGSMEIDVFRFQEGYTHSQENIRAAQEAIDLYRGPFLETFGKVDSSAFELWIERQREIDHRHMVDLLTLVTQHMFNEKAFEQAVAYAQKLVDHEPSTEESHVHLMKALWHNGQGSTAMRQFDQCRTILREELGAEPSPSTVALYQAIRDNRSEFGSEMFTPTVSQVARPKMDERGKKEGEHEDEHKRKTSTHNIPPLLKPFFGRKQELAEIEQMFARPNCRQVTIIGPGGMGKTQLATEYARRQIGAYVDGVWFVSLANIVHGERIPDAIVEALGIVMVMEQDSHERVMSFLRNRTLLLVLDNFEHIVDHGPFVAELLQNAPSITVLATSRERLNLQMETLLPLNGLDLPQEEPTAKPSMLVLISLPASTEKNSAESTAGGTESSGNASCSGLLQSSAISLFVDCAQRASGIFQLTDENQADVVHICRLTDGMPLGIELAAVWTRVLSCHEIYDRLLENMTLLSTSMPDIPERHRSIQSLIQQSWQGLAPPAQQALAQVSVFRGGWAWQAMQAITGTSLHTLMDLIDHSLIQLDATGRYQIHGLVRQFAQGQLEANAELSAMTTRKHIGYYMGLLNKLASDLNGPEQVRAVHIIDADMSNVRVAWHEAIDLHLWVELGQGIDGLYHYLATLAKSRDCVELIGTALSHMETTESTEDELYVQLLNYQSYALMYMTEYGQAQALLERSLIICGKVDDSSTAKRQQIYEQARLLLVLLHRWVEPHQVQPMYEALQHLPQFPENTTIRIACLHGLSYIERLNENFETAMDYAKAALEAARRLDSPRHISTSLMFLGSVYQYMGRLDKVRPLGEEALALAHQIGNQKLAAEILGNMAVLERYRGNLEESYAMFQEVLITMRSVAGGTTAVLRTTGNVARTALQLGKYHVANPLFAEVAADWERLGDASGRARNLQGFILTLLRSGEEVQAHREMDSLLKSYQDSLWSREVMGLVLDMCVEVLTSEGNIELAALVDANLYANYSKSSPPVRQSTQRRQALAERGESALLAKVDAQAASMSEEELVQLILSEINS